ncbi:prevent-host-death protein [Spirochaetia bacterium]|nr:prevent-host-death protein [Spirochaetia bacterium]
MPQIKPITELRNTNEISEFCHKTDEPVYITKNGYGDMVVMSIQTWERDQALLEAYRKLDEVETALANGVKPLDGDVVFQRLRTKYGYGD